MREPEILPTDPKDEPRRPVPPENFAQFLQRTRRYHRLTKQAKTGLYYAKGLDSKPEEMA